jgi:hypothetical protein
VDLYVHSPHTLPWLAERQLYGAYFITKNELRTFKKKILGEIFESKTEEVTVDLRCIQKLP